MSRSTYNNAYILGISFISALGGYLFGFDFFNKYQMPVEKKIVSKSLQFG